MRQAVNKIILEIHIRPTCLFVLNNMAIIGNQQAGLPVSGGMTATKMLIVKLVLSACVFITAIALIETSNPEHAGASRVRFWIGFGLFLIGVAAVWLTTHMFLSELQSSVTGADLDSKNADLAYVEAVIAYYPIYTVSLYVMATYSMFMIVKLDTLNVILGCTLLTFTFMFSVLFVLSTGVHIIRLSNLYHSSARKIIMDAQPVSGAVDIGNESGRSVENAKRRAGRRQMLASSLQ
jgi:hypothetical protein